MSRLHALITVLVVALAAQPLLALTLRNCDCAHGPQTAAETNLAPDNGCCSHAAPSHSAPAEQDPGEHDEDSDDTPGCECPLPCCVTATPALAAPLAASPIRFVLLRAELAPRVPTLHASPERSKLKRPPRISS